MADETTWCTTLKMCCSSRMLQYRSTVSSTVYVCWPVLCRACILNVHIAPQSDEVVQPPQISILVVPLDPGGAMVDRDTWWERDGLSEVNEVDTAHISTVVNEQERASYHLLIRAIERWRGKGGQCYVNAHVHVIIMNVTKKITLEGGWK